MECKFSQQELLLRELKVDEGIILLSDLKSFASFLGKPFYWVPSIYVLELQPTISSDKQLIRKFLKSLVAAPANRCFCRKELRLLASIIWEAAALRCSKISEKIVKKAFLVECFCLSNQKEYTITDVSLEIFTTF